VLGGYILLTLYLARLTRSRIQLPYEPGDISLCRAGHLANNLHTSPILWLLQRPPFNLTTNQALKSRQETKRRYANSMALQRNRSQLLWTAISSDILQFVAFYSTIAPSAYALRGQVDHNNLPTCESTRLSYTYQRRGIIDA
jgi:hypothetical protein